MLDYRDKILTEKLWEGGTPLFSCANYPSFIYTAVWCKGLSELSCPILESFNILCNLWSKIIHLIKSGLHTDIVVESM